MENSDFLFAKPSFVEGMARSLDLYGVLQEYNKSRDGNEADAWALFNDFKSVGADIEKATKEFAKSNPI